MFKYNFFFFFNKIFLPTFRHLPIRIETRETKWVKIIWFENGFDFIKISVFRIENDCYFVITRLQTVSFLFSPVNRFDKAEEPKPDPDPNFLII